MKGMLIAACVFVALSISTIACMEPAPYVWSPADGEFPAFVREVFDGQLQGMSKAKPFKYRIVSAARITSLPAAWCIVIDPPLQSDQFPEMISHLVIMSSSPSWVGGHFDENMRAAWEGMGCKW